VRIVRGWGRVWCDGLCVVGGLRRLLAHRSRDGGQWSRTGFRFGGEGCRGIRGRGRCGRRWWGRWLLRWHRAALGNSRRPLLWCRNTAVEVRRGGVPLGVRDIGDGKTVRPNVFDEF